MTQNICPKCKNEIKENDIRCPKCNVRLKHICPTCGNVNVFGTEKCSVCQTVLIKYCENCGSANLPSAVTCRKCSAPLSSDNESMEIPSKLFIQKTDEQKIYPQESVVKNITQREEIQLQEIQQQDVQTEELPTNIDLPEEQELSQENEQIQEEFEEEIEEVEAIEESVEPEEEESLEEEEELPTEKVDVTEEQEILQENEQTQEEDSEPLEYKPEYIEEDLSEIVRFNDMDSLLDQLNNLVQTLNNTVITGVCAEEGMGKTTIVRLFAESLVNQNIIPLYGENSELLKISPYGTIRDILLKLIALPDIHPDPNAFYSDETKNLFAQNFENLTEQEILNFMNFLYPAKQSDFNELVNNKEKMTNLLEKIFTAVITKSKTVFIIDNFELTDSASFDFIQKLISQGFINNKIKLFITYKEKRPARIYFDNQIKTQNIFSTMYLNNHNQAQTYKIIQNLSSTNQIPESVTTEICQRGKGNIFFAEQFLSLLFDMGYMFVSSNTMKFKEEEPIPFKVNNIEELIKCRLEAISQPELKDTLITAAIMGYKFDKAAFASVADITPEQADENLKSLADAMFLQQATELEYAFKNMTMWSVIFDEAQKDERFSIICKKVYNVLCNCTLSNPVLKATIAKYQDDTSISLEAWSEAAKISAYFGDENVYAMALEQFLLQSGYSEFSEELTNTQKDVMEKIAKTIYKINPQKAIKYLTAPITIAKENENSLKVIDLGAYLIKACYLACDYNGVIETVDLILKTAENELSPLDRALILSKKLDALFKIGNCEEGINIGNNDVIAKLEEALSKENDENLSQKLFNAWFESSVNLIKLYALQGNSKSIEIADNTEEIMQMNGIENITYSIKLSIARAFALSIIGKLKESDKILKHLEDLPEFNNKEYITQKNIIFAMNLVFSDRTENLRTILFNFAKYAEDANDKIGKHIFKLMLAWLTSQEGQFAKANMIFNEELTFFAKEKIVTGALISWLFIAQNTLMTESAESIQSAETTAMKALEVAQNPKFSQYHTAVYLQKLIAEINLLKGDGAAAKMYLEKGMLIAKQFGLDLAQIELYRTFAQFLGYSMSQPDANVPAIAEKANTIYQAAIVASDKLLIPKLKTKIQTERQEFIDYCNQNGIAVKG